MKTDRRSPRDVTRVRVARSLHEQGSLSTAALAERVGLTPAAVRRHLDALAAEGLVESREARSYGPRSRGRPAKIFSLTPAGRDEFEQAYDDLAAAALRYLASTSGDEAVADFARSRFHTLEARLMPAVESVPGEDRAKAVAAALSAEGYAASSQPSPLGGEQICQHHCPVAHVAEKFPQLCEAETEVLSRLLGTHVQRLATIAHGDGVCTTHVPRRKPERTSA